MKSDCLSISDRMNNRQVPEPEPEPERNPQDYAMEIFKDQKRRHGVHHTSANFTLRLTVKPVREPEPEPDSEEDTVVDNFMFRVDLTGSTGEAGDEKKHGRHVNKSDRSKRIVFLGPNTNTNIIWTK